MFDMLEFLKSVVLVFFPSGVSAADEFGMYLGLVFSRWHCDEPFVILCRRELGGVHCRNRPLLYVPQMLLSLCAHLFLERESQKTLNTTSLYPQLE